MPYIVCQHPAVRMDIMVLQQYWPTLVGMIERTGCTYFKEDWMEIESGQNYICLRDVKALKGHQIGEFLKELFTLDDLTEIQGETGPKKFYILTKPR